MKFVRRDVLRQILIDPIGDEVRPRAERVSKMHHASALDRRRLRPVGFVVAAFGNYSARKRWHRFAQRQHLIGVKRHAHRRSGIGREHFGHPPDEFAVAIEVAFDLDHQRYAAIDQLAEIAKRHHPLGGILELDRPEFGRALLEQRPAAFGKAAERVVMMHHRLAVGGELDVAFDREIA